MTSDRISIVETISEDDNQIKDSDFFWIGVIPASWEVKPLKSISSILMGQSPSSSEVNETDSLPFLQGNAEFGPYSPTPIHYCDTAVKRCKTGDVLMSVRAPVGATNVADQPYGIGRGLCAFTPWIDPSFLRYVLQNHSSDFLYYSNGSTFDAITVESLRNFMVAVPPINIQKRIVSYLDAQCALIDSQIQSVEVSIKKLEEIKQSIIFKAVTKGFDTSVSLVDTGIPWIGFVPTDWEIDRIRSSCTLKGRIGWQGLKADEFIDEGPYVITGVDFDNGKINWSTCNHFSKERYDEDPNIHVKEGDLLITKDGTVGKVAIAIDAPDEVSLNSGVMIIRPCIELDRNYLRYVLTSQVFWNWYESNQRGNSTIRHLYQEQFYDFKYPFPPVATQTKIASYLDEQCNFIDQLIQKKGMLLEKLSSLKHSLVYELVTGKRLLEEV